MGEARRKRDRNRFSKMAVDGGRPKLPEGYSKPLKNPMVKSEDPNSRRDVDFGAVESRIMAHIIAEPEKANDYDVLVLGHTPPSMIHGTLDYLGARTGRFSRDQDMPHTRAKTPAADWRERGETDPHAGIYDGKERHEIMGGQFTDDEVAYRCGMASGRDLESISTLHMAKDRIRWLSRMLVAAEKRIAELEEK